MVEFAVPHIHGEARYPIAQNCVEGEGQHVEALEDAGRCQAEKGHRRCSWYGCRDVLALRSLEYGKRTESYVAAHS